MRYKSCPECSTESLNVISYRREFTNQECCLCGWKSSETVEYWDEIIAFHRRNEERFFKAGNIENFNLYRSFRVDCENIRKGLRNDTKESIHAQLSRDG